MPKSRPHLTTCRSGTPDETDLRALVATTVVRLAKLVALAPQAARNPAGANARGPAASAWRGRVNDEQRRTSELAIATQLERLAAAFRAGTVERWDFHHERNFQARESDNIMIEIVPDGSYTLTLHYTKAVASVAQSGADA